MKCIVAEEIRKKILSTRSWILDKTLNVYYWYEYKNMTKHYQGIRNVV